MARIDFQDVNPRVHRRATGTDGVNRILEHYKHVRHIIYITCRRFAPIIFSFIRLAGPHERYSVKNIEPLPISLPEASKLQFTLVACGFSCGIGQCRAFSCSTQRKSRFHFQSLPRSAIASNGLI
jgi:hypothetical protein